MTQSIVVQVGQCGNQIGSQFWAEALKEYSEHDSSGFFSDEISSFFQNVDPKNDQNLRVAQPPSKIKQLKARAVLIDMEEGVLNSLLNSKIGEIFSNTEMVKDVSGAGNNWATGFHFYGNLYKEKITDIVRKECEACDCVQSFFLLHSMGGGTGSGLGTRTLSILADEFSDIYRFVIPIFPSTNDDVITSPYNTTLALNQVSMHGDCIIPIENESLSNICELAKAAKVDTIRHNIVDKKEKAFNSMNRLVAKVILDITASARFDGQLNVDINEISMNLVPFPRANYLIPSLAPLYTPKVPQQRHIDAIFSDVFNPSNHLCGNDVRKGIFLSNAILARGKIQISDIRRNIDRLSEQLRFIYWNKDGWKTGLCSVPPTNQLYSVLSLSNNTCLRYTFENVKSKFYKLFSRKAHLHHYQNVDGMDIEQVNESYRNLLDQISFYDDLENASPIEQPRLNVI